MIQNFDFLHNEKLNTTQYHKIREQKIDIFYCKYLYLLYKDFIDLKPRLPTALLMEQPLN